MRIGDAIKWGAIAGLIVVAVVGIGGYAYLAATGALAKTTTLDRTVVVFSSEAEDGAQVAQIIALVTEDGGKVEIIDPEATATIPGTSYTSLGDAYPFGGARGVADALEERAGGKVAYIDVPESTWQSILPTQGVPVILSDDMEVFNGERLVSFVAGETTVTAGDLPHLMQGIRYLPPENRLAATVYVGEASLKAFGGAPANAVEGLETNLTATAVERLRAALAQM